MLWNPYIIFYIILFGIMAGSQYEKPETTIELLDYEILHKKFKLISWELLETNFPHGIHSTYGIYAI